MRYENTFFCTAVKIDNSKELKFQASFKKLEAVIETSSCNTSKIKHGAFVHRLPRPLREISIELAKIKTGQSSVEIGLTEIVRIAKQMNHNPILEAAQKCSGLFGNIEKESRAYIVPRA